MPWKYDNDDGLIEIIVDPNFPGNLLEMAKKRIVYIVDTPHNHEAINACWQVGAMMGLYEVNRMSGSELNDLEGNLLSTLQVVETHYYPYPGFVAHGLKKSESLVRSLAERGISITEETTDGFVATVADDAPVPGIWALTEFLKNEGRG